MPVNSIVTPARDPREGQRARWPRKFIAPAPHRGFEDLMRRELR
jgi:hypothetical protein